MNYELLGRNTEEVLKLIVPRGKNGRTLVLWRMGVWRYAEVVPVHRELANESAGIIVL